MDRTPDLFEAAVDDGPAAPNEIAVGSTVTWGDGEQGRVDLIVVGGEIPGVPDDPDLTPTPHDPIARVVLWRDGAETDERVAAPVSALTPLPAPSEQSTPAMGEVLARLHAEHEAKVLALSTEVREGKALPSEAIAAAYERGLASWPGGAETTLAPDEWAEGRVKALSEAALARRLDAPDYDLVVDHDDSSATIARADVESVLQALDRDSAP